MCKKLIGPDPRYLARVSDEEIFATEVPVRVICMQRLIGFA
jgi:hypothetical protein